MENRTAAMLAAGARPPHLSQLVAGFKHIDPRAERHGCGCWQRPAPRHRLMRSDSTRSVWARRCCTYGNTGRGRVGGRGGHHPGGDAHLIRGSHSRFGAGFQSAVCCYQWNPGQISSLLLSASSSSTRHQRQHSSSRR